MNVSDFDWSHAANHGNIGMAMLALAALCLAIFLVWEILRKRSPAPAVKAGHGDDTGVIQSVMHKVHEPPAGGPCPDVPATKADAAQLKRQLAEVVTTVHRIEKQSQNDRAMRAELIESAVPYDPPTHEGMARQIQFYMDARPRIHVGFGCRSGKAITKVVPLPPMPGWQRYDYPEVGDVWRVQRSDNRDVPPGDYYVSRRTEDSPSIDATIELRDSDYPRVVCVKKSEWVKWTVENQAILAYRSRPRDLYPQDFAPSGNGPQGSSEPPPVGSRWATEENPIGVRAVSARVMDVRDTLKGDDCVVDVDVVRCRTEWRRPAGSWLADEYTVESAGPHSEAFTLAGWNAFVLANRLERYR